MALKSRSPNAVCGNTNFELREAIAFSQQKPVSKAFGSVVRIRVHHKKEVVFESVGIGKPRCNLKHEDETLHLFFHQLLQALIEGELEALKISF